MASVWKQQANNKGGEGSTFEKPPPGNHLAVLVGIFDMGTQDNDFGGEVKSQRRAFFVWELVGEKQSGTKDRNHVIGIDLTVSLNEKAKLRKWIQARRGQSIPDGADLDISTELGQPCLLNVVEIENKQGKKYPKVDAVAAVPKGFPVPKAQTTPVIWSLDDYDGSGKITLPEWVPYHYGRPLAESIAECHELRGKIDQAKNGSGGTTAPRNTLASAEPATTAVTDGGDVPF